MACSSRPGTMRARSFGHVKRRTRGRSSNGRRRAGGRALADLEQQLVHDAVHRRALPVRARSSAPGPAAVAPPGGFGLVQLFHRSARQLRLRHLAHCLFLRGGAFQRCRPRQGQLAGQSPVVDLADARQLGPRSPRACAAASRRGSRRWLPAAGACSSASRLPVPLRRGLVNRACRRRVLPQQRSPAVTCWPSPLRADGLAALDLDLHAVALERAHHLAGALLPAARQCRQAEQRQ
jgi:hypothetical protein